MADPGRLHRQRDVGVRADRGWAQLNEIVRIPVIEYLAVIVLALILGGGLWVAKKVRRPKDEDGTAAGGRRCCLTR